MATFSIKYCDRCDARKVTIVQLLHVSSPGVAEAEQVELCDACSRSFNSWRWQLSVLDEEFGDAFAPDARPEGRLGDVNDGHSAKAQVSR